MKKTAAFLLAAVLLASALFIAAPQAAANDSAQSAPLQAAQEELALAMEAAPALPSFAEPSAPGTLVHSARQVTIDYSNTADGYVMVKCALKGEQLKIILAGPGDTSYTYNLNAEDVYEVFPLTAGNGSYKVSVYKNLYGTRYSLLTSKELEVTLTDEFAPFLRSNQYVHFTADSEVVALAAQLTTNSTSELQTVQTIYHYVINNFVYDYDKARTVTSGYLPDVDQILSLKKGICFDYASLMTAMLRSLNIPTKLVIGYAGTVYHAWISVYTQDSGWVEAVIFFDGSAWKLMDPTYASTARSSKTIMDFIANPGNYRAKFLY